MEQSNRLSDPDEIRRLVNEQVEAERSQYMASGDRDGPETSGVSSISREAITDALSRNEDGDASLYVELHHDLFCYDTAANLWYRYGPHHWRNDVLNDAMRGIDDVIEVYLQEAARLSWAQVNAIRSGRSEEAIAIGKSRSDFLKRIAVLQTITRKEHVLELARTGTDSLAISGEEWDRDPWLLGVQNGVIDLKTGELRPGKQQDYIKTLSPVNYYGLDTPSPMWSQFISDIFENNQDLAIYIQRLLGYGLTGLTNYHVWPIFYGPQGRNGKGTMIETVKLVLGDLAHKTRSEMLLQARFPPTRGSADADTLAFRGKRIIWASETNEGQSVNTSLIKELTGADTLNARAPYGKRAVEFSPTHLLILLTNNRPKAPADDDPLWDRIHLIPFNIRYVDDPRAPNERPADHDLPEKLKAELPGILAWLVKGCLQWQEKGLAPPDIVKMSTLEYRHDEDEVEQFIDEICVRNEDAFESTGKLFNAYKQWLSAPGKELSMKKFSNQLVAKGFRRDDEGRHTIFHRIGIKAETEV
jgi:putative DNA primase/helicase